MPNKINSFRKNVKLKEILETIENKKILVEIMSQNPYYKDKHLDIIIDETEERDVGLFFGNNCETTISSESICKFIDKNTIKIIDNNEKYNVGMIIRFKSLEPYNL